MPRLFGKGAREEDVPFFHRVSVDFYKKIISSRQLRQKILFRLGFIPDKAMTSLQYRIKTGRGIDWHNPKRYTEKVQVYKTYYRDPLMVTCSDKADVRGYVAEQGLAHILNELYGVYNSCAEIDFDALPNRFVAKDTLGDGAGVSVLICRDKNTLDREKFERTLSGWISTPHNKPFGGREWPYYSGKKHRVLIEKYIEPEPETGGLTDYKFFCFHGEPKYLYVMTGRGQAGGPSIGIYDAHFRLTRYRRKGRAPLPRAVPKPGNFDEMLDAARRLSKPFPHVRVDLYNPDEKLIFGELTFFSGTGYITFEPDEFDYILGKEFRLPRKEEHVLS